MSKILTHGKFYKENPSETFVRCPECGKKIYCDTEGYPKILICTCGCEFEYEDEEVEQERETE